MLVICVTHAEARGASSRDFIRTLTAQGRDDARSAANRFQDCARKLFGPAVQEKVSIERIFSSPKARCVETALLFADEIRELTRTQNIEVRAALDERQGAKLASADIVEVLKDVDSGTVLLVCHGDLANALPPASLAPDVTGGWFAQRPVFAVVAFDHEAGWDSAKLLWCEGVQPSPWTKLQAAA